MKYNENVQMTEEEEKIEMLVEMWRDAEESAKEAQERADRFKDEVVRSMHELGLKTHETSAGKVTLYPTVKCNIVVKRDEFESMLRRNGRYNEFCETKLSLDKVKRHIESNDDDLYGMVELETNYAARYTKGKLQ